MQNCQSANDLNTLYSSVTAEGGGGGGGRETQNGGTSDIHAFYFSAIILYLSLYI
jgi:hypothetical protein